MTELLRLQHDRQNKITTDKTKHDFRNLVLFFLVNDCAEYEKHELGTANNDLHAILAVLTANPEREIDRQSRHKSKSEMASKILEACVIVARPEPSSDGTRTK